MVAINLFHEPTFAEKLSRITSQSQLQALLAALLAFASPFLCIEDVDGNAEPLNDVEAGLKQQKHFLSIALKSIDEVLDECEDEAPSLTVIQALIVVTHCQLTKGVRGRAWRSLGTCIRLAYEMDLHLVDADPAEGVDGVDEQKWCEKEEERRAWWAIWEMDVFASTVRRTPPAMDWSQMGTLLPIDEQDWFDNRPRSSCFMERDPINRWKALANQGHLSPKAWFLVINSLMKEAQVISSPRRVCYQSPGANQDRETDIPTSPLRVSESSDDATRKLDLLANCVYCFELALPTQLRYSNQHLGFDVREPGQPKSLRQLHCDIYNVHLMTQLAKLMIYRPVLLGVRHSVKRPASGSSSSAPLDTTQRARSDSNSVNRDAENVALTRYFGATDEILTIIHQSDKNHTRYINPFLASTIWLASAIQLLRRKLARDEISQALARSKFEVLNMTYRQCASFWDIQTPLQQNLESLEAQLAACSSDSMNVDRDAACEINAGHQYAQHIPEGARCGVSHMSQISRNKHGEQTNATTPDELFDAHGDDSVELPVRHESPCAGSVRRLECGSEIPVAQLPSPPHVFQALSSNVSNTTLVGRRTDYEPATVAPGLSDREVERSDELRSMIDNASLVNGTQMAPSIEPLEQPVDGLSEFKMIDHYQDSNSITTREAVCNSNYLTAPTMHHIRDSPASLLGLGQFFGDADLGAMYVPSNIQELFSGFSTY